jgi:FKBP-type peptidyl-prolyl cis-trans isomerase (trigger factor)
MANQSSPSKDQKGGSSLLTPNTKLTLTLAKVNVSKSYQKHLEKLAKQVTLPGFRQGKVPTKVAEEQLGQGRIIEYVLDELLPDIYRSAVKNSKKTPITHPEFRVVSAKIGEDWTIEAEFAELPAVKLDKYRTHAKTGKKAGAKALIDQKKAAKAKKPAEKPTPEPSPDQAKELQLQYIFRQLVLELKPQVPEMLLKHETQHEFEHLVGQLKQLNITVDDYLKKRGSNMEQLSQELAVQTLNRLQLDLILSAIAKQEKLMVTDKDRENYFAQIKDSKQREELKKDVHYLTHLETNLMKQKVVNYLLTL